MKTFGAFLASALFVGVLVSPLHAQQADAAHGQHHPESQAGTSTTPAPAPSPGMMGAGMPMMDMCRQMMGGTMGMPMMGGAAPADPKEKADMLEMRGEMMKAMGDIMMKHARRMQGMKGK